MLQRMAVFLPKTGVSVFLSSTSMEQWDEIMGALMFFYTRKSSVVVSVVVVVAFEWYLLSRVVTAPVTHTI